MVELPNPNTLGKMFIFEINFIHIPFSSLDIWAGFLSDLLNQSLENRILDGRGRKAWQPVKCHSSSQINGAGECPVLYFPAGLFCKNDSFVKLIAMSGCHCQAFSKLSQIFLMWLSPRSVQAQMYVLIIGQINLQNAPVWELKSLFFHLFLYGGQMPKGTSMDQN